MATRTPSVYSPTLLSPAGNALHVALPASVARFQRSATLQPFARIASPSVPGTAAVRAPLDRFALVAVGGSNKVAAGPLPPSPRLRVVFTLGGARVVSYGLTVAASSWDVSELLGQFSGLLFDGVELLGRIDPGDPQAGSFSLELLAVADYTGTPPGASGEPLVIAGPSTTLAKV